MSVTYEIQWPQMKNLVHRVCKLRSQNSVAMMSNPHVFQVPNGKRFFKPRVKAGLSTDLSRTSRVG